MTPYTLIRSNRRTLSLEITPELTVQVRAPLRCPKGEIDAFVARNEGWIAEHRERRRLRQLAHPEPTPEQAQELLRRARQELPGRVAHYGAIMGLQPQGITITGARTRFGSCSGKNRICFSWRLMDYPEEAIDYVVVHELAHLVHKNHGRAFYQLIESVLPDYRRRRALLKE